MILIDGSRTFHSKTAKRQKSRRSSSGKIWLKVPTVIPASQRKSPWKLIRRLVPGLQPLSVAFVRRHGFHALSNLRFTRSRARASKSYSKEFNFHTTAQKKEVFNVLLTFWSNNRICAVSSSSLLLRERRKLKMFSCRRHWQQSKVICGILFLQHYALEELKSYTIVFLLKPMRRHKVKSRWSGGNLVLKYLCGRSVAKKVFSGPRIAREVEFKIKVFQIQSNRQQRKGKVDPPPSQLTAYWWFSWNRLKNFLSWEQIRWEKFFFQKVEFVEICDFITEDLAVKFFWRFFKPNFQQNGFSLMFQILD